MCVCVLTIEASHCSKMTVFVIAQNTTAKKNNKKNLPFTSSSSMVVLALSMDS